MPSRETNRQLNIASLLTLVAAVAFSLPVIERVVGAAWQWYKFTGYSNDGHISLSFNTGLFFSALLAGIFGLALWFNRVAKRRPAPRAIVSSFWAMCVVVVTASAYWLLGMSSLNVWRA